jgi:NAD+ kinase
MKKIAIYGRPYLNSEGETALQHLLNSLENKGWIAFFESKFGAFVEKKLKSKCQTFEIEAIDDFPFLISFGGDGTVLDTLQIVKSSEIPVIPINMGRIGFLANLNIDEIEKVLNAIENNSYYLNKKNVLKVQDSQGAISFPYALNDFVIQKRDTSSMLKVKVLADQELLNNYWSDGLIIATPSGSSGYSLSCGGPLLVPGSDSIVVTPVAAHNLTVRPIVLPNNLKLRCTIISRNDTILISLDASSYILSSDTIFDVSKADFSFCVLSINESTYFQTLRDKLFWGVDLRNNP